MNITNDNYLSLTERDATHSEALAEKLKEMEWERDFWAATLDEALEGIGAAILGLPGDEKTQDILLAIYYKADEAKFNAFWLRNFAGK